MKWMMLTLILLDNRAAMADPLLDAIYGIYPKETVQSECSCESQAAIDDEGEHYSWDLGVNDSIPETIVIDNPYSNTYSD